MHKPGYKVGHYLIERLLGVGGMGEVYLAKDTDLERPAALKFLSREMSAVDNYVERFLREARAASALNHQNICTVYEIGTDDGRPYISMEYAEGETLAEMIKRRRRSAAETIDIAMQIAQALAAAEKAGIIHRDIKPANVVVNADGNIKLLDFGLAKKINKNLTEKPADLTKKGMILGTINYMSPEQLRGLDVDIRSDIWSLGVCIYEMLTGIQPFAAETTTDTMADILTRAPELPSAMFHDITEAFDSLIIESLAKDASARFASTEALISKLASLKEQIAGLDIAGKNFHTDETLSFDVDGVPAAESERVFDRSSVPNNLRPQFTSIIGRETEIGDIVGLIRDKNARLITLSGVGGTGKTRLSLAVAEEVFAQFCDGIYFIELAGITDHKMVPGAVAHTLGIREEGNVPLTELIINGLADKRTLLILDNFEQVLDAAAFVTEIVEALPKLQIIITSRFTLRVRAETEFIVPPLSIDDGFNSQLADADLAPAVKLFVERAVKAKPSFIFNADSIRTISAICEKIDGLPLAIELAAARVRILSAESILQRLDDRLKILSGGGRDMPERHQTMANMVSWSYDLLDETERKYLRSLSVFNGGFTLEAAESVADGDALEMTTSLLDKSLLTLRQSGDDDARFYMLEVVREFAQKELAANNEERSAMSRHAAYFVSFCEAAESHIQASHSAEWHEKLEIDHDNIRAAMKWSLENDPEIAIRIAASIRNFWLLRGYISEGYAWFQAVSSGEVEPPLHLRFKLMNGFGLAACFRGDFETAKHAYERGLAAATEADNKAGVAISCRGLGLVAIHQSDLVEARRNLENGLAISRELDDKFGIALSLSFLGDGERTLGDNSKAVKMFEEAAEHFRSLDNKSGLGDALNNLAAAYFVEGETTRSMACYAEALAIARELGNKITISHSIDGFAALRTKFGDTTNAILLSAAAEALRNSIGYTIEPAEKNFREKYLRVLREDPDFEADYLAGKTLKMEDVVDLASATVDILPK